MFSDLTPLPAAPPFLEDAGGPLHSLPSPPSVDGDRYSPPLTSTPTDTEPDEAAVGLDIDIQDLGGTALDAEVDAPLAPAPFTPAAGQPALAGRKGKLRKGRVAILAAAVLLLIGVAGAGLATFTNVFGRGKGSSSSAIAAARRAMGDDTIASYNKIIRDMRGVSDENPKLVDPRALEAQAHFALALAGISSELAAGGKRIADFGARAPDDPAELIKARSLQALANNNSADAESWLKALIASGPPDANAETFLGWALLSDNLPGEAQAAFTRSLSTGPARAGAQYGLARALEMAGDSGKALDAYQRTIKLSPNRLGAVVAIERLHPTDPGASEKAIAELVAKPSATSAPIELARAWTLLAERSLSAGRTGEAEDRFNRALVFDKNSVGAKVGLARMLCDSDHVATALPLLDFAVKHEPKNLEALYGMVQAQLLDKHAEAAETYLNAAAAIAPQTARTEYWRGRLEEAKSGTGSEERAAKFYQDAIAADPRFIDGYVMLSNLYSTSNPEKARATLQKAEEKAADDPPLRNKLGEVYLALGDASKAESYFRKVIEKAPTYYKARMNLAATLETEGRLDEADATLAELEAAQKGFPGLAERRASLSVKRQRFDDAAKLYDQALAESQPRATLLLAAGNVNFRLSQYDKAKKFYADAAVDDPRSALAHLGLARIALVGGHFEEAAYEARRSLGLADTGEAHIAAGQSAEMLGKGDLARDEYTLATKGATEFDARMGLARLLARSGAVQDALVELDRVTRLDKSRAEPFVLIGDCYEELSQTDKARKAYEEATKRDLKNGEAAFKLGRNYKDAGKRGIAAELLERAAKIGGEQATWAPEACLLAGDARKEGKQMDAALRDYKRYLEVAPKYAPERHDVQKEIDRLEGHR